MRLTFRSVFPGGVVKARRVRDTREISGRETGFGDLSRCNFRPRVGTSAATS